MSCLSSRPLLRRSYFGSSASSRYDYFDRGIACANERHLIAHDQWGVRLLQKSHYCVGYAKNDRSRPLDSALG